jgi:High potential iron-sulfur protein
MNTLMQRHDSSVSTALATGETQAGTRATDESRRRFMKLNLLGLALAPTASLLLNENAWAVKQEESVPALLDPHDPQAQALDYTPQSPRSDQSCSNCQLYTGATDEESGPCALFSYRSDPESGQPLWVDATGWCRGWAPRQP